jgi:hypothetical protein
MDAEKNTNIRTAITVMVKNGFRMDDVLRMPFAELDEYLKILEEMHKPPEKRGGTTYVVKKKK